MNAVCNKLSDWLDGVCKECSVTLDCKQHICTIYANNASAVYNDAGGT